MRSAAADNLLLVPLLFFEDEEGDLDAMAVADLDGDSVAVMFGGGGYHYYYFIVWFGVWMQALRPAPVRWRLLSGGGPEKKRPFDVSLFLRERSSRCIHHITLLGSKKVNNTSSLRTQNCRNWYTSKKWPSRTFGGEAPSEQIV